MRQRLGNLLRRTPHPAALDQLRAQLGGLETRMVRGLPPAALREAEFQVFSQFGEDGIIQHLLNHVPIEEEAFVEIGVSDYSESNTRFLLVHDNWRGLIFDSAGEHERFLLDTHLAWRHHIDAVTAFVTRDNVNDLIAGAGVQGEIGLLSIDIDGNDYWVLEALTAVTPRLLIVEYNSTLGPDHAVSVPYAPEFDRFAAHSSGLYWGASLPALCDLAKRKGYELVGSNRAGNNAFFVRNDLVGELPTPAPEDAWVASRFRESRASDGSLSYVGDHSERLRMIASLPLWDFARDAEITIAELYEL